MAIKIETIEPVAYATKATAMRGVQRFKDKHGVTVQEATFVVDAGDSGKFPVAIFFKRGATPALIDAAREAGFVVTIEPPPGEVERMAADLANLPKAKRSSMKTSEVKATAAEAKMGETLAPAPKGWDKAETSTEDAPTGLPNINESPVVAFAEKLAHDRGVRVETIVGPAEAPAEPPVTICPPPKALQEIADRRAKIEAAAAKRVKGETRKGVDIGGDNEPDDRPRFLRRKDEEAEAQVEEPAPPPATDAPVSGVDQGLVATKAEAVERALARYGEGEDSFIVKRCVSTGEWFWGAFDERLLTVEERALLRAKKAAAKGEKPKSEVKRERKAAASGEKREAKARGETRPDGLTVGTAAAKMVDAVLNPNGVTYQELLDLTGWGECRPALVKACAKAGVDLRLDKTVKPSRYYGTRAAQAKAA